MSKHRNPLRKSIKPQRICHYQKYSSWKDDLEYLWPFGAVTITSLLQHLPAKIMDEYELTLVKDSDRCYYAFYQHELSETFTLEGEFFDGATPEEALGILALWLLENEYMEMKKHEQEKDQTACL